MQVALFGATAALGFALAASHSLWIKAVLSGSCRGADQCDFGRSGAFSFGALPGGLFWTSESGLFL